MRTNLIYLWTAKFEATLLRTDSTAAAKSTYKKLAVQWLNQVLYFYQSLCLVDSEMLPCLPAGKEIANFL
jgi:hypothetical protein